MHELNAEQLSTIVALLAALSVVTERFVEIIKNLIPLLNKINDDENKEGWRKAILHLLAVICGISVAYFTQGAIKDLISIPKDDGIGPVIALGLLASGGSGFWNSSLTYVSKLKELKKEEAKKVAVR